jgi:hypothetical protein
VVNFARPRRVLIMTSAVHKAVNGSKDKVHEYKADTKHKFKRVKRVL